MSHRGQIILRIFLGILNAIMALNAFAGGYYALSGAKGVPTEWLSGSPFHDYVVPGLFLFIVVGGAFLIAAIAVFARLRIARSATRLAVAIVLIWLVVQVAIIGYVSWMQPATGIVAIAIALLGSILPKAKPAGDPHNSFREP